MLSQMECRPIVSRSRRNDGLTIVELLIALFIVMLAFAALASTIIASFTSIRNNEARVRATALASEAVEEMATMPWFELGLYSGDLDEDDDNLDFTDPNNPIFENELVVLVSEDVAVPHESTPATDPDDLVFGGLEYTITRYVTFAEQGDADDLKRMTAIVSWSVGGEVRGVIRSDGLRAPDPGLGQLTVELSGETAHPEVDYGTELSGNFRSEYRLDFLARGGVVAVGEIRLIWRNRDGDLEIMTKDSPGTATWEREFTIDGGPLSSRRFQHGPTTFTVIIEGVDGETASDTFSLRFYQPVSIGDPSIMQGGQEITIDPTIDEGDLGEGQNPLEVCADGFPADTVTLEVDVEGMTGSEATPQPDPDDEEGEGLVGGLTVSWEGLDGDPVVIGLLERNEAGGSFEATLAGPFVAGENTVVIEADRLTPEGAFDDIGNLSSFEIWVEEVGC